ncbi:MAG: hypothetical protein JKY53_08395 [Flavobacteriales bacterium]|nr:hypothetical protein [Flavobacteriales bacterium]
MKVQTHILVLSALFAFVIFTGCKKHNGYETLKEGQIVESDLLDCLGKGMITELVVNEFEELEDSTLFTDNLDSTTIAFCWGQYSFVNVDFSSKTLIGVGYQYLLDNSSKNGSASVKIYKNSDGSKYIIDVYVDGADKSGVVSGVGQIWFSIPKADTDATFEFNKNNV